MIEPNVVEDNLKLLEKDPKIIQVGIASMEILSKWIQKLELWTTNGSGRGIVSTPA
jgi:hypothetical protein